MANLLMLQDQLGEDFRKKGKLPRKASKAALAGKMGQESPSKEMAQMPPKYQLKEDDDKQVTLKVNKIRSESLDPFPNVSRDRFVVWTLQSASTYII